MTPPPFRLLQNSTQNAPKRASFRAEVKKIFWGGAQWGGDTPSPHPTRPIFLELLQVRLVQKVLGVAAELLTGRMPCLSPNEQHQITEETKQY